LTAAIEQHCSRLIFAADSTATPDMSQLRRVREPVSRSKAGIQGKVADVIGARSRHAESQNEIKAWQILTATARADSWQEQPFTLEYHDSGAKHRYTPDALVVRGSDRVVVEVKEDKDAETTEARARFSVISEHLAGHGYQFCVWKSSEIRAEPRLANVGLILRYRCVAVSPNERSVILRAAASETELSSLCASTGAPVQNVLRLVLDGSLHIDWWTPVRLSSMISVSPIGRQEWPAPSAAAVKLSEEAR
jgi:hypothetical protein